LNKKLSPVSFFSLHLELYKNGNKMGDGTGFMYKPLPQGPKYLVTNYHIMTGRDPKKPEMLLPGFPDSPDEIVSFTLTKPDYKRQKGSIKIDDNSQWLEHRLRHEGVDTIAIPLEFPDDAIVLTQDQLDLVNDIEIEAGSELFIVGFPWGFSAGEFFPIWKRGTIASEPLHKPNGIPKFYIDAYTTPGMSGSPVFAVSRRIMFDVNRDTHKRFEMAERGDDWDKLDLIKSLDPEIFKNYSEKQCLRLVGIYSGKVYLPQNRDPNVGIVWQKELIDELFSDPVRTKHPYPPIYIDS